MPFISSSTTSPSSAGFPPLAQHPVVEALHQGRPPASDPVEAPGDDARLGGHQLPHRPRGAVVAAAEQAGAAQPVRLAAQAVEDQAVVVPVRRRLHEDGAVDALLLHVAEVPRQRIGLQLRLVGGVAVEGKALLVGAEHVGVPLDDHVVNKRI